MTIPTCDVVIPSRDDLTPRAPSRKCGEPAAFKYSYYCNVGTLEHKLVCIDCAMDMRYRLPGAPNERIFSDLTPLDPYVGMPCTIRIGSDRHPATVIFVSSKGSKIVVREDTAIRTDQNGMSESQVYRFEPNPAGQEHDFFRPRIGQDPSLGLMVWGKAGKGLVLGERSAYHDYSF